MRNRLIAAVVVTLTITLGWLPITAGHAKESAAATTPEMCNGRSDPNLSIRAQASGDARPALPYFVGISTDSSSNGSGSLIVGLPASTERLVVTDWCRVWQHRPGQPSSGSCGLTYPAGATTAHAVGTTEFEGQKLLVRTDVRELASGSMLYRVRYRPLATETAVDDCETGWSKLPAEGWYTLDSFHVDIGIQPVGYRLAAGDGGVFSFDAPFFGSMAGRPLNQRVVGITTDPVTGGYWLVAADGGVFSFNAPFYGPHNAMKLNRPIVAIAEDPPTNGYWLVASDGGVFSFGDAGFSGSMGGQRLNAPVVGMASDPATGGYWLVAADGGVFAFGGAPFLGSMGGKTLNAPIVGMAADPATGGYWLVAADGGIFAFGAPFFGSMGGKQLNAPMVGMAPSASAQGYTLAASDGGVFSFGDAVFYGSRANAPRTSSESSIVSMSSAA